MPSEFQSMWKLNIFGNPDNVCLKCVKQTDVAGATNARTPSNYQQNN